MSPLRTVTGTTIALTALAATPRSSGKDSSLTTMRSCAVTAAVTYEPPRTPWGRGFLYSSGSLCQIPQQHFRGRAQGTGDGDWPRTTVCSGGSCASPWRLEYAMLWLCAESKLNKVQKGAWRPPHYLLFSFASCLARHQLSPGPQLSKGRQQQLQCWAAGSARWQHVLAPRHSADFSFPPVLSLLCVIRGSSSWSMQLDRASGVADSFAAQPVHTRGCSVATGAWRVRSARFRRVGDTRLECGREKSM